MMGLAEESKKVARTGILGLVVLIVPPTIAVGVYKEQTDEHARRLEEATPILAQVPVLENEVKNINQKLDDMGVRQEQAGQEQKELREAVEDIKRQQYRDKLDILNAIERLKYEEGRDDNN